MGLVPRVLVQRSPPIQIDPEPDPPDAAEPTVPLATQTIPPGRERRTSGHRVRTSTDPHGRADAQNGAGERDQVLDRDEYSDEDGDYSDGDSDSTDGDSDSDSQDGDCDEDFAVDSDLGEMDD